MNAKLAHVASCVSPGNVARREIVRTFLECAVPHIDQLMSHSTGPLRVAVIGGHSDEPELDALRNLGFSLEVVVVGLESSEVVVDLNSSADVLLPGDGAHLVLCSQVLEHVWNHGSFFRHLRNFTARDSLLWLAAPKANRPHASPDFYSAGFTASYMARNLENVDFRILASGEMGSRRLYESALLSRMWFSGIGYRFPVGAYLFDNKRPWTSRLALTFYCLPQNLRFGLLSKTLTAESRYATESWVLAQSS